MLLPHSASFTAPDDLNNTFNGSNYEPDFWNATAEQQTSVFDLLAEDGASGNLERSPVHESHVAFSVEGLGKVGTQTPVHSPQQTGRMFQYGCSSPQKAARRPNLSEKFNNVLDDFELDADMMMQDTNTPLRGSYSEFSTGVMNSHSNEKHNYSTVKDYALFDGHGSKIKSSFDDSDIFVTGNVAEDLWDGSPAQKHQTSEHDGDFLTSKRTRYPAVGRNFGLREVVSQPDWSLYEDARDNLSSLSNPLSPLILVRGEASNELPSISMARQSSRRSKNTFGSDGNMYNPKNIYVKETQCQNGVDMQRGSYKCGSGKGTSTPTQLKPKLFDHVNSPFQEKFDAPQSWLFEEGYTSANTKSGFSSFCQTPKTKFPSSVSKPLMEDGFPTPESHINAKSSYDGSKYGEFVECSPFGSFGSDFKFNKPFSCLNREGSPTFSKVDFGQSKPDLFFDSEAAGTRAGLFHGAGSHGERLFPDLSVQESVSEDEENKSTLQPDNLNKFELGKQSCAGNDCSISENKNAMDSSNTEHNVLECKKAKDGIPERKESLKATYSPEPGEEASSSVKIPDKFHSSVDKKEYNEDAEAPLRCPNDHQSKDVNAGKDDDDARPEQRKIVSKRHGNCVSSSLPVVMLESFVLQLLCVQKKA
ncbi:hypothetical protein LWI28_004874 [Acer negundo]|uniref:Uncharacterized protein n=1 Tax=Acer negundo TaxID=4023 RepID=A0AAD5P3Q9_ACENE|nr:hypothetical protein LWI28_004874 [Acer negundo]